MAIIKCKNCGNDISTKAKVCPHCNNSISKKEINKIEHYGLYEETFEASNMKYEYLVKSFIDESTGDTDPELLERLINNYARQGWRLKQIYTNEIGKNSVGIGFGGLGSQTNATMERTFVIFEREVK